MTTIRVWQMPACWGLPNASPFCMKLETWLRMAGIDYEVSAVKGPPKSSTGKVPYIERPDGSLLSDSGVIIETLRREHGVQLDEHLDAKARAETVMLTRLFEDHLYWAVIWDRWVVEDHWRLTKVAYFGELPPIVRDVMPAMIRRSVTRTLHGQGLGRLSPEQIVDRAKADIHAVSVFLEGREFLFGRPSTIDAIAYAFLGNIFYAPIEGPIKAAVNARANLVAYCERMKKRWWSTPHVFPPTTRLADEAVEDAGDDVAAS